MGNTRIWGRVRFPKLGPRKKTAARERARKSQWPKRGKSFGTLIDCLVKKAGELNRPENTPGLRFVAMEKKDFQKFLPGKIQP